MDKIMLYATIFAVSFMVTVVSVKLLLPVLRRLKMGQKILEIGPSWHLSKQGTPTMGGIAFPLSLAASAAIYALFSDQGDFAYFFATFAYIVSGALIGFTDDSVKMRTQQNEGLSASSKLFLQLVFASLYTAFCVAKGYLSTEIYIPFAHIFVAPGRVYHLFAILMLTGISNAVNFTDGLDGLCSSVTAAAAVFFALISFGIGDFENIFFSLAVCGICLGFLIYNFHPAKIFMGDTGSLFLGSAIGAIALGSGKNTIVFIIGVIYIAEALSVILQVIYFKLTKKRLFLMAPLHHHFEKKGFGEVKIVFMFTAVTVLCGILSYLWG